jgi:hypothetical protein
MGLMRFWGSNPWLTPAETQKKQREKAKPKMAPEKHNPIFQTFPGP